MYRDIVTELFRKCEFPVSIFLRSYAGGSAGKGQASFTAMPIRIPDDSKNTDEQYGFDKTDDFFYFYRYKQP